MEVWFACEEMTVDHGVATIARALWVMGWETGIEWEWVENDAGQRFPVQMTPIAGEYTGIGVDLAQPCAGWTGGYMTKGEWR